MMTTPVLLLLAVPAGGLLLALGTLWLTRRAH